MEYKYSVPLDPSIIGTQFQTTLPLRKSMHEDLAIRGSENFKRDWEQNVGPVGDFVGGGSNPKGHIIALLYPETIPERIEIMSYFFDHVFFYDDEIDHFSQDKAARVTDELLYTLHPESAANPAIELKTEKMQIQAKIILDILAQDREKAELILTTWKDFVASSSSQEQPSNFRTFEECISYRIRNAGADNAFAVIRYGMNITLTDEELKSVSHLSYLAKLTAVFVNDYFSYEKEKQAFLSGSDWSIRLNAVTILAREHSTTVGGAKQVLAEKILAAEKQFRQLKGTFDACQPPISKELQRYLSGVEMLISGNYLWHSSSPRYNKLHPSQAICPVDLTTLTADQPDKIDLQIAKESNQENGSTTQNIYLGFSVSNLDDEIVLAPFNYINSLPSKSARDKAIDALNVWLQVPEKVLQSIKSVITMLHSASLMLDDIEDSSPLRRSNPATHTVFGQSQTINSANYLFVQSLNQMQNLGNGESLNIFIDELKRLHIGQSLDVFWTYHVVPPTEDEYVRMIDGKTGGLFRLLGRLMKAESPLRIDLDIATFMTLVGRFFQIRDDYQNLLSNEVRHGDSQPIYARHTTLCTLDMNNRNIFSFCPILPFPKNCNDFVSQKYTNQKGFCEDLDEGKFSLPLIHLLASNPNNVQIRSILQERRRNQGLSMELKKYMLEEMRKAKSLEYTRGVIKTLEEKVEEEIGRMEDATGEKNWIMRLLLDRLKI